MFIENSKNLAPNRLMLLVCLLLVTQFLCAQGRIIIDADLSHFSDDHEALAMLATLHKNQKAEIMGVTLVTGNHWLEQMEIDTLKALERLNLVEEIPVYLGAEGPLLHSQQIFEEHDRNKYGSIYAGAWDRSRKMVEPPGGPATQGRIKNGHAVNFIINSIRDNPGKITIAALGPLTNLALAFRIAPDIVSQINNIIYMGGAFFVTGNVTAAAEFNWWFDAEAAAIVLSQPIRHVIVPLDATDKIPFNKDLYDRWVERDYPNHFMVTDFLIPKFASKMKKNPDYTIPVWDALVAAYMAEPRVVTNKKTYWVSVDTSNGPNYGRSLATPIVDEDGSMMSFQPPLAQKAEVILSMDERLFWQIYESLLFAN